MTTTYGPWRIRKDGHRERDVTRTFSHDELSLRSTRIIETEVELQHTIAIHWTDNDGLKRVLHLSNHGTPEEPQWSNQADIP